MADKSLLLTQAELKRLLSYNPETGVFVWLVQTGARAMIGDIAGTINSHSYRVITINGKLYKAHRLAWLYMHGMWPENEIDHINGDKTDNRVMNLREASHSENLRNRGKNKNNMSGIKGVSWHVRRRKWEARLMVHGRLIHLGYFAAREAAAATYTIAAEKHHGVFRPLNT